MTSNTRFIKSVIKAAQDQSIEMPWARGKRRQSFIASRKLSPAACSSKVA